MGVRGLTTYITYNEDIFLKEYLLYNCNLVIDGHSLCAQLYQKLTSNSAFGGEYDKYAAFVRKFFLGLRKCKISSYVLFDGSLERKKLRTAFSRLRSKLRGVARLYPGNQSSLKIFPLLLRDVFKEVLVDLKIPHTVCEFEADDEIAALARHLNCPVLSYDSDFFIYNVLYVPFNTVNIKPAIYEEEGCNINVIECKLYSVENFIDHFGGLKKELLPVLATLLGNDYVKKRVFRNFFSHLKMPKSRKKKNDQQKSIQAVLEWLRNETLESAVVKIVGRLKKFQKHRVITILRKSCEAYNKTNCASLKYFDLENNDEEVINFDFSEELLNSESEAVSDEESEDSSSDDSSVSSEVVEDVTTKVHNESELPTAIIDGIRQGFIPQQYINLYTHGLYFCIPQAEDCDDKDSFLVCLPILRYSFDILTNFSGAALTYVSREGSQFKKLDVPLSIDLPNKYEVTPLGDVEKMHTYFSYFITSQFSGLSLKDIETLPNNIQLTMLALIWWMKHCRVSLAQVYAVLLGYIMLDIIDEKTGTPRGQFFFNNKNAKKIEEIKRSKTTQITINDESLHLNKNKVSYDDCLVAASSIIKLFEMDAEMKKRPKTYNIQGIHSFAQFQCCLQQINYLNTLCCFMFESSVFSKTYNGVLAYNLMEKLAERREPMLFVEQYLKGADTVLLFFKSVCSILDKCMKNMDVTPAAPLVNIKRRGGRKKGKKEINFLCEGFQSEVII